MIFFAVYADISDKKGNDDRSDNAVGADPILGNDASDNFAALGNYFGRHKNQER